MIQPAQPPAPALRLACAVFFLSGGAALIDQVMWQRLLVIFSGADVYSATVIVAAFMVGLGAGSLAGGHLADRVGRRASLWGFVCAELAIGTFAIGSKTLYYDVLYARFPQLASSPAVAAVVLLVSLLWPTFFMGMSLPLLARALTSSVGTAGAVIGSLYGWNTLGAATGAFGGTWLLLPLVGIEHSLRIAGGVSLACAALGLLIGAGRRSIDLAATEDPDELPPSADAPLSFRWWAAIYGLTGFVALALEIAWFRVLGVVLKSTAFTFGTLLAVYLSGIGLGAVWGARRAARSRHPGRTFLVLQLGACLYAAVSTAIALRFIGAGHPIKLVRYLGGYEPVDVRSTVALSAELVRGQFDAIGPLADFLVLYVVVPALLIGPPTLLLGASFAYLQRAVHADLRNLGRRLGVLISMNIAGGALGAMVTGWVLLPTFGTATTLRALVGAIAVLAWPLSRTIQGSGAVRHRVFVAGVTLILVAVWAMPRTATFWARLHGTTPRQILFDEDGAGVSLLKAEGGAGFGGSVAVFVNGLGQSWIPYGGVHTALGALPVLLHPNPRHVVIIGLGSGDTAFAAAGRSETQRVTSVEIIGAQRRTLERLALFTRYPGLLSLLSDPRIEHRVGDGRAYLLHSTDRFDIIEADALRPTSAYAGNLYSREYFDLLRRRLAPGGLAVTWAPTPRVERTFGHVFPYVLGLGPIYFGSDQPIAFNAADLRERARAVRAYYDAAGIDILATLEPYLVGAPARWTPESARTSTDLNTDTFPRDEFR